jgi:glycylpeptide N-tetradecanoyltransferase
VTCILNEYLGRYKLHQQFLEDEVRHFLTPRESLVYVYVVEDSDGNITDFCSFYCLPSSILNNRFHSELRAAFMCAPCRLSGMLASYLVFELGLMFLKSNWCH